MLTKDSLLYYPFKALYASAYLARALQLQLDGGLPLSDSWKKRLPNVFIVGGKRCGTTHLKTLLSQHSDVYVPSAFEEARFFDRWHKDDAQQFRRLNMTPSFGDEIFEDWTTSPNLTWLKLFGPCVVFRRAHV